MSSPDGALCAPEGEGRRGDTYQLPLTTPRLKQPNATHEVPFACFHIRTRPDLYRSDNDNTAVSSVPIHSVMFPATTMLHPPVCPSVRLSIPPFIRMKVLPSTSFWPTCFWAKSRGRSSIQLLNSPCFSKPDGRRENQKTSNLALDWPADRTRCYGDSPVAHFVEIIVVRPVAGATVNFTP